MPVEIQDLIAKLYEWGALYGLKFIGALIIFIIGIPAAKIFVGVLSRALRRAKMDPILINFSEQIIRIILYIFIVVAAINKLGVQTASVIAVLGGAALAVSLALQNNLSSLAAGVMILMFRPFKVGDFIEAAGTMGTVNDITIMSTKMTSPDGKSLIIPNTKVLTDNIVNWTDTPFRRIDLVIGIGYEDDLVKAKNLLLEILKTHPKVLDEPAPSVVVMEHGDSSINFAVRPWTKAEDNWAVRCELLEIIKLRFDEEKINIPYPQRDVHLISSASAPLEDRH